MYEPRDLARVIGVTLRTSLERWLLSAPLRIAGYTDECVDVMLVELEKDGLVGRGEAAGVYYKEDKPTVMLGQVESLRSTIERSISRSELQRLLLPGGARNALDCALWDLEAKLSHAPAWQMAGLEPPRPLLTTFTCGADEPDRMAASAKRYTGARAIKVKLTGDAIDGDRVRSVRDAVGDVWLGVDANQGLTLRSLEKLMPILVEAGVKLIEQPFPIGQEAFLDGLASPIPLAADESAQSLADLPRLVGRFDVVNIKLDKCGGLTEGLAMARAAREYRLQPMVGNMLGTSLAMAPAFLLGQVCNVVDLDGPLFLKADRSPACRYIDGTVTCPPAVWGHQ